MRTGKIISILLLLILMLLWGALLPTIFGVPDSAAQGGTLPVYTDALAAGWEEAGWSWDSTTNLANTNPVTAGTNSIGVTYDAGWSGLQLGYGGGYLDVNAYDTLRFWIHGGSTGGQPIEVQISFEQGTDIEQMITPQANTWTQVDISLIDHTPRAVYSISWFNNSGSNQDTFYLDDITFVDTDAPTPTPPLPTDGPALSVDAAAERHPISPYIYGMNFASEELAEEVRLPVRRRGGNSTTRYNWEIDVHNVGSDWYFENIPNDNAYGASLPHGSSADLFVEQDRDTGTKTLLTMPLIGWTPKTGADSHPYDCGFKVSKYGSQDDTDYWDPDCGNGEQGGTDIIGNDPHDTSIAITTTFVTDWINHLTGKYGTADEGGVMFYNLDNEPMLWSSTHRDVHPSPPTYDEMRDRTYLYAAAIKAADPMAQTLGPVTWGWCSHFYSAADGCSPGADRAAHGNMDFTPWYLAQMQDYEDTYGVRILDYLDLHCYPHASGVSLSSAGNAQTQALRLRSTRTLWDSTYTDESWVSDITSDPIRFIPRGKQWVAENYPGTKTACTEYNWGALDHINGALAQADVLGIFGREGLDLATLWGPPDIDEPGAFAFRMYRNYDGAGSGFGETSVQAASTDQDQLAIYAAQRDSDKALTLMIINKTGDSFTSTVSLANFQPGANAEVYRYSNANLTAITPQTNQPVTSDGFTRIFPANSITLVIIPPGGGPITGVNINGPDTGVLNTTYIFTTTASPLDASTPITYTWAPEPDSGQDMSAATYSWNTIGSKTITVTAENSGGSAVDTHTITITAVPITGVTINGPATGVLSTTYTFTAMVSPANASTPITYTWTPPPLSAQGLITATYNWDTIGDKTITVTAENSEDSATNIHTVAINDIQNVYLPVVLK